MVVGLGTYQNQQEAFPLDKKTLNKIALRSLFMSSSRNAETGESIGWCWAIAPGLKKIHENEEDLALSMGHHLEFASTGSFFSTLSMGIVLSLEQQKCDLETIRSVRTAANALCESLSASVVRILLLGFLAIACASLSAEGSMIGVALYAVIGILFTLILRFSLIRIGYAQGTKIIEKMNRNKEALKHASQILGAFTIGALIVLSTKYVVPGISYDASETLGISLSVDMSDIFINILPGLLGIAVTYLSYVLLTKKNWSIAKCILLIIALALILGFFGFWTTISAYSTPISWPWM